MKILGISAFYHDSAAALVEDGQILSAAHEERYSRVKHDSGFPALAIAACLKTAGLAANQIDAVVFYEKPFLKFERLIETYLAQAPKGFLSFQKAIPVWLKEKFFQKIVLRRELRKLGLPNEVPLLFSDHHLSHGASAFYPSPFEKALILTMDGVGEWATTSVSLGNGLKIEKLKEIQFPHSIGLLYSAFTFYCGFKVNSGEYKLMGLAPYGKPIYADLIRKHLIEIKADGSFALDLSYFDYVTGLKMTSKKFHDLFGGPPRKPEVRLEQKQMDLAASIQLVLEEVVSNLCRALQAETGARNLCLAGGVALNCVANGRIAREKIFDRIWVQPASGDAGGALGAALAAAHLHFGCERQIQKEDSMQGAYLGNEYTDSEISDQLARAGAVFSRMDTADLLKATAQDLSQGRAVAWFQGRMEFGPRSLGARSILADPRSGETQKNLNLKVKYRESFRPFAPAVLLEDVDQYFEWDTDSPYMLMVAPVRNRIEMTKDQLSLQGIDRLNIRRSEIPAVTHLDYSARLQTVSKNTNPLFHQLLTEFKQVTGCSVLVNTSFNVRGEPIVESPGDAFRCFMGTEIERLVIGNYYFEKEKQNPSLREDYKNKYQLD